MTDNSATSGAAGRDPEVVELLSQLIRNACVNDGTEASGNEVVNANLLRSGLEDAGCELETYEPLPGRVSLVARIEGTDPHAPGLCYLGHTDVVPVNTATWSRDPFGGELVDGELWGRGAVDMLNITASMAVAFGRLARSGFRPEGHPDPGRGRGRGGTRDPWRALAERACRLGGQSRLRDHRDRGNPHRDARREASADHSRREGQLLVPPAGPRRRRPRFRAAAHRQRLGHGGRRRRATRRLQGAGDDP